MIQLTDSAVAAIKTAISRASENATPGLQAAEGLRIMVQTGGCAGFKYMMGLEAADPRRRRGGAAGRRRPCSSTASRSRISSG